jgi:hypothetical protein
MGAPWVAIALASGAPPVKDQASNLEQATHAGVRLQLLAAEGQTP